MSEFTRFSSAAVVLLVALRLGIGWQLLYEGLWKIQSLKTPTPWTSEGYLKNSQGPMRNVFRALTGDPDDLQWMNAEVVESRWDSWRSRFVGHYKLNDRQKSRLNQMVDGASAFVAPLATLPPEVDFKAARVDGTVTFDATARLLKVDGRKHLMPAERQTLEEQVADKEGPEYDAYRKALSDAFARSSRLSAKERMRAHLVGNPENAGLIDGRISELELYRQMVDRHQQKLAKADIAFEFDHLNRVWSDTRSKASEVSGPVKAIDSKLRADALEMLSIEQLQRGPLSEPWSALKLVDLMTIAGLTVLGGLLVVGLCTRFAALSAAFMVFGFFMAMPPFPGVPEAPGPEHSFIVNKNLIEVLALLALAFVPTGRWFGLDGLCGKFFAGRKKNPAKA